MKSIILAIIFSVNIISASGQDRIKINILTVEDEANYIWNNIRDIKFFEQYDYQVIFLKDELIDSLLEKSRRDNLQASDYNDLKKK